MSLAGEATAKLFSSADSKSERDDNADALRGYPADIVRAILTNMPWQGLFPVHLHCRIIADCRIRYCRIAALYCRMTFPHYDSLILPDLPSI